MASQDLVREAARRLADAAPAEARVILFGSHARGQARPDSDLDFMVIERDVPNRVEERVRLRAALSGLDCAVDLLVVSEDEVEEWGRVPCTVINEALTEGTVLAGA